VIVLTIHTSIIVYKHSRMHPESTQAHHNAYI